MRPTRPPLLLVPAAIAAAAGYLFLQLTYVSLPPLPGSGPVLLFLLALIEAIVAVSVRARLAGRPGTKPIMPIGVARIAALAKATSLVAALALGGYVAVVAYTAPQLQRPGPAHDLPVAAGGVAAALVLAAAALFLERACRAPRVPPGPDGPHPERR